MVAVQRQLSEIKKNVLIFMLSVERCSHGLYPARYIKQSIKMHNVYATCYSLESAGLVRTAKTSNRHVLIELTDAGRIVAASLKTVTSCLGSKVENRTLPFRPQKARMRDILVELRGRTYAAGRAAYVIRSDGSVSLGLWSESRGQVWLSGNIVQVAEWYQACYDAGLPVQVQIEADSGFPSPYERAPVKLIPASEASRNGRE